ncbi:hypothetical protein [Aneurinibacillus sp. REN35]|uniref:hypothetical protein n=1 Tax=Aneurinibacillus sp. REN35 TaxID=3237286 RepID=UPI003526D4FE
MRINDYGLSPVQQMAMMRLQMTQPTPSLPDYSFDLPLTTTISPDGQAQRQDGTTLNEPAEITRQPSLEMTQRMLDFTLPAYQPAATTPFMETSSGTSIPTIQQDNTASFESSRQDADVARQIADIYTEQLRQQAYRSAYQAPYTQPQQLINDLI